METSSSIKKNNNKEIKEIVIDDNNANIKNRGLRFF